MRKPRELIGRVNRGGESLGAHQMRGIALMIHESGDPHHALAVGCGRIGAELLDQLPNGRFRLFFAEPLHLPRNLPVVGRC